jgi:hypothetical protein
MHVMIDIETLGTNMDAVITQVGAVAFDPAELSKENYQFNPTVAVAKSPVRPGIFSAFATIDSQRARSVTDGTIDFWFQPDNAAGREAFILAERDPLPEVLLDLANWFQVFEPEHVWANGAVFDLGILRHAYAEAGLDLPWDFRAERDTRTLKWMAGTNALWPVKKSEIFPGARPHHAADDALWQATEASILMLRKGLI